MATVTDGGSAENAEAVFRPILFQEKYSDLSISGVKRVAFTPAVT